MVVMVVMTIITKTMLKMKFNVKTIKKAHIWSPVLLAKWCPTPVDREIESSKDKKCILEDF